MTTLSALELDCGMFSVFAVILNLAEKASFTECSVPGWEGDSILEVPGI